MNRELVLINHVYRHPRLSLVYGAIKTLIGHLVSTFEWFGVKKALLLSGWHVVNGRRTVNVEVIRENTHTLWVRLPDGNIVKRKKRRDLTPAIVV